MLSVYFPVCSLALPRPETGTLPKQPSLQPPELALYFFPSMWQKAPKVLKYKVSDTLQKFLSCRSWFLFLFLLFSSFFFFFTFHPQFTVICKIVLCLKELSPSVWSPSPWVPRVWVIIRWSGKRGLLRNQSLPAISRCHPQSRHNYSMVTVACTLLVVFNEPLPTRMSHFLVHHTIMYSLTEIAFKRNLELSLKKKKPY